MAILKWQPFSDLLNMYDRVNRLFEEEHFGEGKRESLVFSTWTPLTDIYENKDAYLFKMELPGFQKDQIKIDFNDGMITIGGERQQETDVCQEDCHRVERSYGAFQRSFTIPKNVDPKKIDASLKDGILNISIAKVEEAKTKAIPINVK